MRFVPIAALLLVAAGVRADTAPAAKPAPDAKSAADARSAAEPAADAKPAADTKPAASALLPGATPTPAAAAPSGPAPASIALPGGPPVSMDYLAYDAATGRLWIPAGNTGRVDVLDTKSGKLEAIEGQATKKSGERTSGPSSASVGEGYVYVGSRADWSICAFDAKTLARKGCATLDASPDGVAFIAPTKEVWVTTPRTKSIAILSVKDGAAPVLAGKFELDGAPEGYAVDTGRAIFYTNLEDKDRTLAIDARTHKVVATWKPGCGEEGPRGLAIDSERRHLHVACTDRLKTLDAGKEGAVLGELPTGGGVDNIDWLPSRHLVYVASGKEAKLTVAEAGKDGSLKAVVTAATTPGGRTVIIDGAGTAYIPDSKGGRLVVVKLSK